jgi:hypothetical protein
MARGTIVKLDRISGGAPEQWEGKLSTGQTVYARERHGTVRVELDGMTVSEHPGESAFDALTALFDLAPDVEM